MIYRFGVFEANLGAHELRKHGVAIRLHGQPFDLLAIFLERSGEIISREEMQAKLWPSDTFVDFERSLNAAVKKLRAALADSPDRPLYIETIPRVGYRFIAPVTRITTETIVTDAIAKAPGVPPKTHVRSGGFSLWIKAALAGALLLSALGVWLTLGSRRKMLAENDRVVIADFVNRTQDPTFDLTLARVLRVSLAESPFLNLISEADYRRARKATDTSPGAMRQACVNAGGAAIVDSVIEQVKGEYRIRLTVTRCAGGSVLASAQQTSATRDGVLDALGRTVRELRVRLREPQESIARFSTPIGQSVTSSLAALKAFSTGDEKSVSGADYETIPQFQLAVDLDPDFAVAYARLGTIYGNAQEWELAKRNLERAFALRQHASERDRLSIAAHYYGVNNEIDKEVQVYELWRQFYPRDLAAPNNLSNIYIRAGEVEKGVAAAREAVRLAPDNAFCVSSLVHALQRAGLYSEAKALYQRSILNHSDSVNLHLARYTMAFGEMDTAEMDAQLKWAQGNPREGEMLDTAAWGAAALGRIEQARLLFQRASQIGLKSGLKEYAALVLLDDAQMEADLGFRDRVLGDVENALGLAGDSTVVQAYSVLPLSRIGELSRATALAGKASKAEPLDTLLQNVTLPEARALAELSRHNPAKALEDLEIVKPYDLGTDANLITIYYRGQALFESSRFREAAAEFRRLIGLRLANPNSPYVGLAQLGLAEAEQATGDFEAARSDFAAFFELWKNADQDLPVFRNALKQYRLLQKRQADDTVSK